MSQLKVDSITDAAGTGSPSFPFGIGVGKESQSVINVGLSTSIGSNLLTVNLKQSDGSTDPTSANPVSISFRSSSITGGSFSQVSVTSALSINTVATGASLGLVSGQDQFIYVYAINNAGTIELALAGSKVFNEGDLHSTTAMSAGSTDNQTLYSTSPRSDVAIRLIGRIKVNLTTAGTYDSNPSALAVIPFIINDNRSMVWVSQANGYGSTNNKIRRWSNVQKNIGSAITYTDSATDGGSFTINEDGVYGISYSDEFNTTFALQGISVNSNQLTTSIDGINAANRLAEERHDGTNTSLPQCCAVTAFLQAGDVIRAHTSGSASGGQTEGEIFVITKIS